MSKLKKWAIILTMALFVDIIAPGINAMAITENQQEVEINNNLNGDESYLNQDLSENSNIEEVDKVLSNLSYENQMNKEELDTELILSDETNQEKTETLIQTIAESVIEGALENPTSPHRVTGDLFVKGFFVSTDTILKVEVFVDNSKVGDATYGIDRQDIANKYKYPNADKSGFEFALRNVSDGNHVVKVVATNSKGITKDYSADIIVNNNKNSIMGTGKLSKNQMANFLHKNNPDKSMSYILNFVDLIISEASLEGINHDILFSQIMNETGYLKFGGDVKEEQNNFAGIGATGNGNPGNSFPSIQIGIRAVVQHLKAYASSEPLKMGLVDPRFNYVQRASAIYVEYLGIKENPNYKGWAAAKEYGYRLLGLRDSVSKESTTLQFSYLTDFRVTGDAKVDNTLTIVSKANNNGTMYKIEVLESLSNNWITLSDWSATNTIKYVPKYSGEYTFKVSIKSKDSTTIDDYNTISVNVVSTKSKVTSLTIDGNKSSGSVLTMEASADPINDTLYKLWVCDRSTNTWTVISDWSTKNTINYTPKKAGRYTFTVHVKHKSSSSMNEDDYKSVDIVIANSVSKVSSLTVSGDKFTGSELTMSATATPAADTLYKLWVCDRSTNTWTVISDWSTKNTIKYTPKKAGRYTFTVHVKNKYSTSKEEDDYRSMDVMVTSLTSKVSSLTVSGDKFTGSELTMSATATPAADTLYKLWVCDRSTNTWTVISDWSTKNTIKYTPKKAGRYTFTVHVKNKYSTSKEEDDYRSMDVMVTSLTSKVSSLTVSGDKFTGSELTMSATATPAADTLYKLWVCDRSTNTWTVISDWSTKNTIKYTPKKAGRYTFTVHVKNKYSTSKEEDDYRSMDVMVTSLTSKISSLTVSGDKFTGSELTMSATATPAADTLYKLWVCDRSTNTWTVISDWSTKNTIKYTPKKAGRYTFTVHVKNKYSTSKEEEDYRSMDVTVTTSKSSISSIDVIGYKTLGETLTLNATANPTNTTLYKLWICDRSTDTWTVLSDWSTKNSINYTPSKIGKYTFTVHVKNMYSNSAVEEDYKSMDFYVTKENESMVVSLDIKGEIKKGSKLTIEALGAPENNTLYKIWACDRSTNKWIVLSDWSNNRVVNYTIPSEGTHTFTVHVKHKNSKNPEEDDYLSKDIFVKNKLLIVVDPGHNHGGDFGAVSTVNGVKYEETELNMQIADYLRKELESRGHTVVMTREVGEKLYDQLRVSLQNRVDIANRINADLFVSIHHNTNPNSSASGVEVYYTDVKPESGNANANKVTISKSLAEVMVNNLSKAVGQINRGAKNDDFYVVKNTLMPSVLVEAGFITNPQEVSKITKAETQKLIAAQLANSIESVLGK